MRVLILLFQSLDPAVPEARDAFLVIGAEIYFFFLSPTRVRFLALADKVL